MSSKCLNVLLLCGFVAAGPRSNAVEPEELLEIPLALAFGAPPTIGSPMLSPDGSRLVFLQQKSQGTSSDARDHLDQASPLRRTEELEAPVLMFHGAIDMAFDVLDQTLVFARSLERADKDVVAIEYPRSMHDIERGPDRIDMLTRMRGFLAEHIGPELAEQEGASVGWRP